MIDQPLALPCGVVLRNRIVKAAMSEQLADARHGPSTELIALYARWADCGAAALITGNVMVDRAAVSEPGQVVVESDIHLELLKRWAVAASAGGAATWMQINHGGRQIPRLLNARPVAPSAVAMNNRLLFARPRALGDAEIVAVVRAYASTAERAVQSGFGGVQLHAAHGYLASQFLSSLSNRRDDRWGGDAGGRSRFLLELVEAVRAAIGSQAVLSVKLNASDFQRGGITPQESLDTVATLSRSSIDLLEISGGTFESAAMLGVPGGDGRDAARAAATREAYFLDFARSARARFDKPLMVTGGFRTRGAIDTALQSGAVDLVGLARPIVLDAQLPLRLLNGSTFDFAHELQRPRWLRRGLSGGLAEVAWHTVQLWRCARGEAPDIGLGAPAAMARYLARQTTQMCVRGKSATGMAARQREAGGA